VGNGRGAGRAVAEFHRFMNDPAEADRGCVAKLAVVEGRSSRPSA
jgi:hypothetical protein